MRPKPKNMKVENLADRRAGTNPDPTTSKPALPDAPKIKAPKPPTWLAKAAHPIWKDTLKVLIGRGTWDESYITITAMFCHLAARFMYEPETMNTAMVSQLRLLAGDLGFSPTHINNIKRRV